MIDVDIAKFKDYYLELEKTSEFISYALPSDIESVTEDELLLLRVEYFAQTALDEDSLIKTFDGKKYDVTKYLTTRISNTSNVILKAKYNNFIFILTRNNSYCQEAIKHYQQALSSAFQNSGIEHYELHVDKILERVIDLSIKIKFKIPELKSQIIGYLSDSTISKRLLTRLFMSVKERNLFNGKESESFSSFFIKHSESTSDTIWVEHNLNIALFFANKSRNTQQIQTIYELLGDNKLKGVMPNDDLNLAVPHINEQIYESAIDYYKKAKCEAKLQDVWRLHCDNKNKKRYAKFEKKVPVSKDVIELINSKIEVIASLSSFNVVSNLVLCKLFLFQNNNDIEKRSRNTSSSLYQYFTLVQVDRNENHKKSDSVENNKFYYYHIMMEQNLGFIIGRSILRCIEKRKLSFKKLHKILLTNTSFGLERHIDYGDFSIRYTWLSMIDIALESFFEQCNKIRKGIVPDWRICIDILAIKFEGIFREILESNGANLTILENGDTKVVTLENMIRLSSQSIKDAFYLSFDDDDLNLFQYVFSSKAHCINLRNNVAHAFYPPQAYTEKNAILALLSILRLAKFVPRKNSNG